MLKYVMLWCSVWMVWSDVVMQCENGAVCMSECGDAVWEGSGMVQCVWVNVVVVLSSTTAWLGCLVAVAAGFLWEGLVVTPGSRCAGVEAVHKNLYTNTRVYQTFFLLLWIWCTAHVVLGVSSLEHYSKQYLSFFYYRHYIQLSYIFVYVWPCMLVYVVNIRWMI